MQKQHAEWLEDFLKNCQHGGRSTHTVLNYRSDLLKFIQWFELMHDKPLYLANAKTMTQYKEFLTKGGEIRPAHRPKLLGQIKLVDRFLNLVKKIFKRPRPAPETFEILPSGIIRSYNQREWVQSPLSVASRKRHLSAIKNFFEFLKETHEDADQLFEHNPVKQKIHGIRLKDEDVQSTVLLTLDDWKAICDWTHRPRERFIVHLLYFAGLRLSELARLKVSDFNYELKAIKLRRKGGRLHTLFVKKADLIFTLLERHLNARAIQSDILFLGRNQRPLSNKALYNLIMKIFVTANCKTQGLTPHSFRKACATNLYYKTRDLLFVRDYLNHTDAKVTQTYIQRRGHHNILSNQKDSSPSNG